jgi:acyl dehydratase
MSGGVAYESWRSWIGKRGPVLVARYPVSAASVAYFCEFTEDGNPLYYDTPDARARGGPLAPPTFVATAVRTPTFVSDGVAAPHQLLAVTVPLDITARINVRVDQEFLQPVRHGDLLRCQSEITDIVPKRTKLGSGYFITEEIRYWNQREELVAVVTNTVFSYRPGTDGGRG